MRLLKMNKCVASLLMVATVTVNAQEVSHVERISSKLAILESSIDQLHDVSEVRYLRKLQRGSYASMDLHTMFNIKASDLDEALAGTGLHGLAQDFIDAANTYKINAIALVGICGNESGMGSSDQARLKNNLCGFCAYTENPGAATTFSSKRECIFALAKLLSEKYISKNGPYYNGNSLQAVNIRYAADKEWATKASNKMKSIMMTIADNGLAEYNATYKKE